MPQLLPASGIGVDGPHLIIAPSGNPEIRLDCRLLDNVELVSRSVVAPYATACASVGGLIAAAMAIVPGGVFLCAGLGYVAYERFSEGWRRSRSRDLLLALGSLEVALHVADGPEAAKRISDFLSPYTRQAPISGPKVYEDAKERLRSLVTGKRSQSRREAGQGLRVGEETVYVADGLLHVGTTAFRIDEVREYAIRGANLPLSGGRLLQAALGLLVVAADERAKRGEDPQALAARIKKYEQWTGRMAGR